MNASTLTVRDLTGLRSPRPVTGGVPLAEGTAPRGARFTLTDARGRPVPLQTAVLVRWPDASAKWVLLDFSADPPAGKSATYRLTWSKSTKPIPPDDPVRASTKPPVRLATDRVRVETDDQVLLAVNRQFEVRMTLSDGKGRRYQARTDAASIETRGPLRGTMQLRGDFRDADGERAFSFRLRVSVFAGLQRIRLEPMIIIDPDHGVIQPIRELAIELRPLSGLKTAKIDGAGPWTPNDPPRRLFQIDDQQFTVEGTKGKGRRAAGWARLEDNAGNTAAVALRDFWQQWPKSIELDRDSVSIGLLPRFRAGTFDHMQPWYKHQYLFKGSSYCLRTGQARRWDLWLDLAGDGQTLAAAANAPLVPAADPAEAIATGVWGPIAPVGAAMRDYDRWADRIFELYRRSIEINRDYGAMNWGDWWGERGCNWGNHEYDTPRHMLVQFARTGDPKYFHAADAAARHMSEVDIVHCLNDDLKEYFHQWPCKGFPPRPGMVHEHCVGHVGGFDPIQRIRRLFVSLGVGRSKNPYLCLDPYNLGHLWTEGMVQHHFLTGDPWLRDTVELVAASLLKLVDDGQYAFAGHAHSGRTTGWPMTALAAAYELRPDRRYLRALRKLADGALAEQDPNCGGWLYELPWGHCFCRTRKHVGEAGFLTSVRVNGLARYHDLAGDRRIPEAIRRAVTHINNDTWLDHRSDWRYTSCPATKPFGQIGVTVMALVNSVRLTGDVEHLRILRKAWHARFQQLISERNLKKGHGKTYALTMLGAPEAAGLLANLAKG